jgi:hypothetical protein
MASNRIYTFTSLTGGTAGSLDDLKDSFITDNDIAITFVDGDEFYIHIYDSSSSVVESSPLAIIPDTAPTTGRWIYFYSSLYAPRTNVAGEWSAQQNFNEAAITSTSNSVAWNLDTAQNAVHTMTENTTIAAPTNMNAGGYYTLRIVQGSGPYTLAWNAAFDFGAVAASSAPSAEDDVVIIDFYSDGTTMYAKEKVRKEA